MITGTIVGNLGRDAETKNVGQSQVVEFTVASTQKRKGEDHTTWVRVVLWGKTGERVAQHLTKGAQVAVSGEMSLREYQKRDGGKGVSLEMNGDRIKLLGGKRDGVRSGGGASPTQPAQYGEEYEGGGDDDLPFLNNVTCEPVERWWR